MAGVFGSLEIARRALLAHQMAQRVVGQNVANAATPGYSRQRVELAPVSVQSSPVGAGVEIAAVRRIRERFLDFQLLSERQELGSREAREGILLRLEGILYDTGEGGIGSAIDAFFGSLQTLSARPTDTAAREAVVQQGSTLASVIRQTRDRLDSLKEDLAGEISLRVDEVNDLLSEIASINGTIQRAGNAVPNELLDQRDQLVTTLGKLLGVSVVDRADGTVQLTVAGSGIIVMDGATAHSLTATTNLVTDTIDLTVDGVAIAPASGALASVVAARNDSSGVVKQAVTDLDSLVATIIEEVNRLHSDGAGLTGHSTITSENAVTSSLLPLTAAGLPFTPVTGSFQVIVHDSTGSVLSTVTVAVTAGTTTLEDVRAAIDADPNLTATITGGQLTVTAGGGNTFAFANDTSDALLATGLNGFFSGYDSLTMDVSGVVMNDSNKVAAARADAAGLVHQGDNQNARAMAELATALTMSSGTATFTGFYGSVVGRVGAQSRDAQQSVEAQTAAVELLQNLEQQTSGVSIDEEMANLMQSQYAYQAAARYINVVNDMLDTLINRM